MTFFRETAYFSAVPVKDELNNSLLVPNFHISKETKCITEDVGKKIFHLIPQLSQEKKSSPQGICYFGR